MTEVRVMSVRIYIKVECNRTGFLRIKIRRDKITRDKIKNDWVMNECGLNINVSNQCKRNPLRLFAVWRKRMRSNPKMQI